jgi:hypothetical protein
VTTEEEDEDHRDSDGGHDDGGNGRRQARHDKRSIGTPKAEFYLQLFAYALLRRKCDDDQLYCTTSGRGLPQETEPS